MKSVVTLVLCMFLLACTVVTQQPNPPTKVQTVKYDMLDWMTMDDDLAAGFHMHGSHDMYTVKQTDKFYWVKSPNGYPWDIQLVDNNYIYLWITDGT